MNFTYEEHIRKHTRKENTYHEDCDFCNGKKEAEK